MEHLIYLKHNCSDNGFISFESRKPLICPYCKYIIGDWSISIKNILTSPFSVSLPCNLVLKANNSKFTPMLHIGISNSNGNVYHFNEEGLIIDLNGWDQCLNFDFEYIFQSKNLLYSKFEISTILNKLLSNSSNLKRWKRNKYNALENNCYDYVLEIINSFLHISKILTLKFNEKSYSVFKFKDALKAQNGFISSDVNNSIINSINFDSNMDYTFHTIPNKLDSNDKCIPVNMKSNLINDNPRLTSILNNDIKYVNYKDDINEIELNTKLNDFNLIDSNCIDFAIKNLISNNYFSNTFPKAKLQLNTNKNVRSTQLHFDDKLFENVEYDIFANNILMPFELLPFKSKKLLKTNRFLTRSQNDILSKNKDNSLDSSNVSCQQIFNKSELTLILLPLFKEAENYLMIYKYISLYNSFMCS